MSSQNCPTVDTAEPSGLFEKVRLLKSLEELDPNSQPASVPWVRPHNTSGWTLGTNPPPLLLMEPVSMFKTWTVSASSPVLFTDTLKPCLQCSLLAADWPRST